MLEVGNLHYAYESGTRLLDSISFSAEPGNIIWLQGVNGSGKTTLLKIIAQLIDAQGEIRLDAGQTGIPSRSELLSRITYIPSEPYLFDYLTGEENAEFMQKLFAMPEASFQSQYTKNLAAFGMEHVRHQLVQEYSLGMRHKLVWSVMLCRTVDVLLLDEPFSAFDEEAQQAAGERLRQKAAEGAVILFVSHLREISLSLATRIFRLQNCRLMELSLAASRGAEEIS